MAVSRLESPIAAFDIVLRDKTHRKLHVSFLSGHNFNVLLRYGLLLDISAFGELFNNDAVAASLFSSVIVTNVELDSNLCTPLMLAALSGDSATIGRLLARGAKIEVKRSALVWCV